MWKIGKMNPKLDNSLDTTEAYILADLYKEEGMSPLMENEFWQWFGIWRPKLKFVRININKIDFIYIRLASKKTLKKLCRSSKWKYSLTGFKVPKIFKENTRLIYL